MSGDQDNDNKGTLSTDAITEVCLDLSRGITDDDKLLWKKDKNAVDFSLNYAKLWCKFCKDLVATLEKKASIETESCRSLAKQMQSLDSNLSSTSMIGSPLRSETLAMTKLIVDQCKEIELQNSKRLGKLLDVISRQKTEFSKTRKVYKDKWKSDCKKMSDAENLMWKTRTSYYQRCQQGVKLREELESSQSLLTYMLDHGIQDSVSNANVTSVNTTVSQSSAACANNDMSGSSTALLGSTTNASDSISASQLSKQKVKVDKLEKQLADNDKKEIEMMYSYKESVENANNRLIEFEKKKLEHLCDIRLTTARNDEVVKDTMAEYLRILFETRTTWLKEYSLLSEKFQEYKPCQEFKNLVEKHGSNKPDVYSEKFQVELFHDSAQAKEKSDSQTNKGMSIFGMGGKDSEQDSSHRSAQTNRGVLASHSDSDSDSEITGFVDTPLPSGSKGTGVLNTIVEFGSNLFRPGSSGTGTQFDNRRTQSQVKNKKSTSGSTSSMTGNTEWNDKDQEWQKEVELAIELILKCINFIELNGLTTHGIYRVSASKLKIGSVIDSLNNLGLEANLENEQPITLASVVKSKLISLSEPLIPYNLYTDFVELGKEAELGEVGDLVSKLGFLINQIPPINKKLVGLILHHLKKIANNSEENQMGSTNLGTLFAPTLIKAKPRFRMADLKEYMDNKSQAKIVQLMIENVEELMGAPEQYYVFCRSSLEDGADSEPGISSKVESSNKASRPRSSIIECSETMQTKADFTSPRPLSGSYVSTNIPPLSPNSSQKIISDKPAPKLMDMLLEPEVSNTLRVNSPRLRERKLAAGNDVESEHPVTASTCAAERSPTNIPQRSISLGSGPSPDAIKLVQLSQPSNDSIFSKGKETETISVTSLNTASERSIALRKSFLSSNDSKLVDISSNKEATESKYSAIKNSHISASSRIGSSTSRSHFSHSSDLELPSEHESCHSQYSSMEPTHLFPVPLRDSSTSSCSFVNKHFVDIYPRKITSYSHASPTENSILRHQTKSHPFTPFIRQSTIRSAFIARSMSDLRASNPYHCVSFFNSSPLKFFKTQIFDKKCHSLDCLQNHELINYSAEIETYQRWLSEPTSSEFFV